MTTADIVSTQQVVPNYPGPTTDKRPDPIPIPRGHLLPAPVIGDPLKACQYEVLVAQVFDGATVTVSRERGPTESTAFDLPSLWFGLSTPLAEGEKITVKQAFSRCERNGDEAIRSVESPKPVEIPYIDGNLCEGSRKVPVAGLIPGAQVLIIVGNSKNYVGQTPPGLRSYTFDIGEPLPAGKLVTVKQERCGIWGTRNFPRFS